MPDEPELPEAVDLVAFLAARWDEEEAVAKAATSGPWTVDNEAYPEAIYGPGQAAVVAGSRWGGEASVFDSEDDAAHIALHDPAHVLADLAAKRAILALHPVATYDVGHCCSDPHDPRYGEVMYWGEPCPTVRALVSVFRTHPDFDPAWEV